MPLLFPSLSGFHLRDVSLVHSLAAVSAAGLAYTGICRAVFPSGEVRGSPLYNWYSCLPIQLLVFPAVAYLADREFASSFPSSSSSLGTCLWRAEHVADDPCWLTAPWHTEGSTSAHRDWDRVFLLAVFAYMIKDTICPMDAVFAFHHLICVLVTLAFLTESAAPPGAFILGTAFLEIGSATQTLIYLNPHSWTAFVFHVVGMTASNIGASWLGYLYFGAGLGGITWLRWWIFATTIVLSFVRQLFCWGNCKEFLAANIGRVHTKKQ